MPGALHDGDDFTRDIPSSDSAEGACQPAGDHRMAPVEKPAQQVGSIGNSGKDDLRVDRTANKADFGNLDQRGFRRNQIQAVAFGQVCRRRHLPLPEVVERCAERKPDGVVGALRRVDDELGRDGGVFRVEQQGLLRGQVPVLSESCPAIRRAEFPEGREPGGRVAGIDVRVGGDQPTLHDLAQKAVSDQALAMNPCQFRGAEDTSSPFLELFEPRQRCGKFLARGGHGVFVATQVCCVVFLQVYCDVC